MMAKRNFGKGVSALGLCLVLAAALSGCDDEASGPSAEPSAGAGGESAGSAGDGSTQAGAGPAEGGSDSADGGSDSADGGNGGAAGALTLDPPPSIDLGVCEDQSETPEACSECCANGSFSASTYYDSKCVCGMQSEDTETCSSQPAAKCTGCCKDAGYARSSFDFGVPTQCSCQGQFDKSVCSSVSSAAEPEPACRICCLNNGFLHGDFDASSDGECTCSS